MPRGPASTPPSTTPGAPPRTPPGSAPDRGLARWARELAPLERRGITVLIDVSNKCNIRCRMCYFHFDSVFYRQSRFLSPERFERIAERLFPLAHTVYLSAGNEPLTSPHFGRLLEIAAPYRVPDLKFLTNALLVTPELARTIVASGVNQVHVSIDGATRETYEKIRVGGEFEKLKRGVRLLAEAREASGGETPHLQFNVTLMRSNLDELDRFVDLAEELGVTRIAARHLMPYEGLDLEQETLQHVKAHANRRFAQFLERVARSESVRVVNWPDFFAEEEQAVPEHAGVAGPRRAPAASSPSPAKAGPAGPAGPAEPRPAQAAAPTAPRIPRATLGAEAPEQPHGSLDLPLAQEVVGADQVVLSGWALDPLGVERVWVSREPLPGESAEPDDFGLVPLGQARLLTGARPDVVFAHPEARHRFRHAFTFTLERAVLPASEPFAVDVHVLAEASDGRTFEVGRRRVVYDGRHQGPPPRSCEKPFENVYIDAEGNVYPYPDCQTIDPFGNVDDPVPFEEIWFGPQYTELRERILAGDPPDMCLNCPNFINRNVDDDHFFAPRAVEGDFRKPVGYVDTPDVEHVLGAGGLVFSGWALGFEEFAGVRVELRVGDRAVDLGEVVFHEGTRPDVAARYRRLPGRDRAGWTFLLTPEALPTPEALLTPEAPAPGAQGPHELIFRARNQDGASTVLGRRRVRR